MKREMLINLQSEYKIIISILVSCLIIYYSFNVTVYTNQETCEKTLMNLPEADVQYYLEIMGPCLFREKGYGQGEKISCAFQEDYPSNKFYPCPLLGLIQ